jgi:hypothetical protein
MKRRYAKGIEANASMATVMPIILIYSGYLKESDLEPTTAIKWIDNVLSKFRNKDN